MYSKEITLNIDKPNLILDPLWAGQSSDCLLDVSGLPAGFSALFIFTHAANGSTPMAIACEAFTTETYRRFKINGNNFPTVEQMTYEIVAYIEEQGGVTKFSCGKGYLNIYESNTTGTAPIPPSSSVPINVVYNLTTGKLHRLFAETNELGQVTLTTEATPIN